MDQDCAAPARSAGVWAYARTVLAVTLTLAALSWAADLHRTVGFALINEQFNAFILALALALVFISVRANGGRGAPPLLDIAAAIAGFAAALYVAWDFSDLDRIVPQKPPHVVATAGLLLLLVLEGLRRLAGNVLTAILGVFILYGLLGHHVPGQLQGRYVEWRELMLYLSLDPDGVFGSVFGVAATVIVAFLFFGALLNKSGGADFFTKIAMALMGGSRGGGAKISILASSLFGTISGNAVSNVATTGIISIPLMKSSGYKPHHAGAIEAVASTGGQLMPPVMGAAAFIMAELLAVPYRSIVIAAIVPAVLYYAALFIQADLEAAKSNISPVPRAERPSALATLREGWFFPIPFVVVIFALFVWNESPETAALYAAGAMIFCGMAFGYRGQRMKLREVFDALVETGLASLEILMIAAAAGFIIGVLNVTGLSFALTSALVAVGQGNLPLLLLLAALISIVMGMGMPTVGVYVLLAALVAPALVEAGVSAIAAHLFVMYFGMMSMTTPPVAVAAYAAASIAQADPMKTAFSGVRFGWSAYIVPFLFVASPNLILQGQPLNIALAVITAIFGVYLVSVAVAGFMVRPLGLAHRLAFGVSGLAMMTPANAFEGALLTDIAGFAAGMALIVYELRLRKLGKVGAPGPMSQM